MRRKHLLPTWIRFFSWIFLFGLLVPLLAVLSLSGTAELSVTFVGWTFTGTDFFVLQALVPASLLTLAGVVAYGLLWDRAWAVDLGIVYGLLALTANGVALAHIANLPPGERVMWPMEWLILIPFLVILVRRRALWREWRPEDAHSSTPPSIPSPT